MEIHIVVHAENIPSGERFKSNEAYYTFVALDRSGSPLKVPALKPESEDEQKRFDGALRRRQLRLVLAGKMKPDEATELKALFITE
jgi:acyl-CoA hydrolase